MSLTKRTPEHPRSYVLATAAEAVAVEEAAPMPAVAEAVPTVAAEAATAAAEAAEAASGFGGAAAAAVAVEAIGAGCQLTVGPGVIDIDWCCRAPGKREGRSLPMCSSTAPTEADAPLRLLLFNPFRLPPSRFLRLCIRETF
jgi:hypothetical protein